MPESSINRTVLDNGLRVVSESVPYLDSVTVGIWVAAGSRHELPEESGISHFLEHMLFKGTERRSARQIADEMDMLGGHLNAFTEKESTFFYAKILGEHLDDACDILSDMLLNSTFAADELECEKKVVLEEIKRREDAPDELVHEIFEQAFWKGHPLGNSIIGDEASVSSFTRDKLIGFMRRCFTPDSIIVSAAGSTDHQRLVECAAKAFGSLKGTRASSDPRPAEPYFGEKLVSKATEQVHLCFGTPGFRQQDDDKYTMAIMDAIIGGGMSSRLFQEIREKRGLAYAIGSYSASYNEGGVFVVYAGLRLRSMEEVVELIIRELQNIRRDNVTDPELERAKNQIRGALLMGQESTTNRMSRLASSELYFGRIIPLDEVLDHIATVSKDDIARVADQVFQESHHTLVAVGPFESNSES